MDFNIPTPIGSDEHEGAGIDGYYKTNVASGEHPLWSDSLVETINNARNWANTKEPELSGKIDDNTFQSIAKAELQTKFPADLLVFMMDWDNDITSGGGNAQSVAMRGISYTNELRSVFGRDPMHAEVFCAHAMGGASLVKQLYDLAEQKPEEEAKPIGGGKKQNIIYKKLKNNKETPRNNREVYDFFWKRIINGKMSLKKNMGDSSSIQNFLTDSGNTDLLKSFLGT